MGRRSSLSSAVIASNSLRPSHPCAAAIPSSVKCARKALITFVRCRISRSRAVLHQLSLLLDRLNHDEPRGWAPNGLADRRSVGRVISVVLDVTLHIFRRHQRFFMAELNQLARVIICRDAGLHANRATRQCPEKLQHLATPQLLRDCNLSAASIPWTWNTFVAISKPIERRIDAKLAYERVPLPIEWLRYPCVLRFKKIIKR